MPAIACVLGDLTAQRVDAVVNAANSSLMGGGGVDGAIHRAGGPSILEACRDLRRTTHPDGLPPGHVAVTTAGDLPATWVIHTVGPIYSASGDAATLLRSCHVRSLHAADAIAARSVAFPAISTGAYGYPPEEAAPVATSAVLDTPTGVEEIRFVLLDERLLQTFREAIRGEASARGWAPDESGSWRPPA